MRYLVDTDWAVWWLRGRSEFVERLQVLHRDGVALSAISLAELETGIRRSPDPARGEQVLTQFLRRVAVLPFTDETARRFGEENARLLGQGYPVSQFDLAIAATALQHVLILLTENRKHYERIRGLSVESLKGG